MRISGLVAAIKGFTHMDQAMVAEPVDLGPSLSNTVAVLKAKARQKSIAVDIEVGSRFAACAGICRRAEPDMGKPDRQCVGCSARGRAGLKCWQSGKISTSWCAWWITALAFRRASGNASSSRFSPPSRWARVPDLAWILFAGWCGHNDGLIEVESEPGRTEFRVALPIAEPIGAGAERMNKPVLLIVDDDPQVLRGSAPRSALALPRELHRDERGSGDEALTPSASSRAAAMPLAIIISDQRMPGMMGSEVLAQSRSIYPLASRVLLTAYSDIDAAVKAINEAHLDHYLSKPWDPPEERLFPAIDDLAGRLAGRVLCRKRRGCGWWAISGRRSRTPSRIFWPSNLIPYRWVDVTRDADARALLDAASVHEDELPALFFDDGTPVLRNPDTRQVAERLGKQMTAAYDVYDLAIVGAGPAGLAAAVYGASEGLRTLLLDRHAPGGQAGTSSRIENYLGFPAGVSGSELTRRALTQAQRLGAEFLAPLEVTAVSVDGGYKRLALSDGREIVTRAMLATTGMFYREHPAAGIAEHTGAGVYYGAATTEAAAFRGRRVLVVGGGNSAGQGAMYLARYAKEVDIVIRRESLQRHDVAIPDRPDRQDAEYSPAAARGNREGGGRRARGDGPRSSRLMTTRRIPKKPRRFSYSLARVRRSDWLPPEVLRDAKGFVLTGRDLMAAEGYARIWKEQREPLPLETSVPGVFAAGDLRAGAMNRVASAVGEGSMVVRLAHEYLALT